MHPRIYLLILAFIILVIICFFTARVFLYGLKLGTHTTHNVLAAALLLPILYMANLVGTSSVKWTNRTFYIIINVIAGIFFYLFLGAIVLGIVSIIALLNGHEVPTSITWSIFAVSLAAGIIGMIQARYFVVTNYTVSVPDIPEWWHNKTLAMVSDTHFGLFNQKKFSDKVVQKILSLNPDIVIHAGDFYDGPSIDTDPIIAPWKTLAEQIPMFYTPGNHEMYGDYEAFVASVRKTGATVLDDRMTEFNGMQIAGTLYHRGRESADVAKALTAMNLNKAMPTILINHPPTSLPEAHEAGATLMLSGHTHRGQFWPLQYITRKVYNGYDYKMKKYEDMNVITSNGIGTFDPPMRFLNSPEVVLIRFQK